MKPSQKEILHKFALDSKGHIVSIENALVGAEYFCPNCRGKFNFRKGKIRQQHYSHQNLSPNCTGEGYLHKTFKVMAFEKIATSILNRSPILMEWRCEVCNNQHKGNLLHGISDVRLEQNVGQYRPDITLVSSARTVPTVIEIVVTHEPEEAARFFYKTKGIVLVRIKLEALTDLEKVEQKLQKPENIEYFAPNNCPSYRPPRPQSFAGNRRLSADDLLDRQMRQRNRRKKR